MRRTPQHRLPSFRSVYVKAMSLSLLVHTSRLLLLWLLSLSVSTVALASDWIDYPPEGTATLTHYTLPDGYVASCGCTGASTRYPTAAMSQFAYGSSNAYGPGCGRCFKITLLNSVTGTPLFYPEETKSIVIKVTDLCPGSGGAGWCSAKPGQPNQYVLTIRCTFRPYPFHPMEQW